ncbi:MAG: flagellar biosynthesis anti-sigma factor FlgM [Candidatus Goldiibacteriota bacterium]|jgi:hypothetical protein
MAAINNTNNIKPHVPQTIAEIVPAKNISTKPEPKTAAAAAIPADRIEISRQAKAVNKAVKVLNELPEVRQELVQKAQAEKVEKTGNIPPQLLSQKMLFQDETK